MGQNGKKKNKKAKILLKLPQHFLIHTIQTTQI